jgi:hypothetical protein
VDWEKERPYIQIIQRKKVVGALVLEHLPCKQEAVILNPSNVLELI